MLLMIAAFVIQAEEQKPVIPDHIAKYLVREEVQRDAAREKVRAEFLDKIVDVKPDERAATAAKYQALADLATTETHAKIGYFLKVGDLGYFINTVKIVQVLDDRSMLINTGPEEGVFMLRGFPTADLADDDLHKINGCLNVSGTESYTSASGAKRTVRVIDRIEEMELQKWREQWLADKPTKPFKIEIPKDIDQLYAKRLRDKKAAEKKAKRGGK